MQDSFQSLAARREEQFKARRDGLLFAEQEVEQQRRESQEEQRFWHNFGAVARAEVSEQRACSAMMQQNCWAQSVGNNHLQDELHRLRAVLAGEQASFHACREAHRRTEVAADHLRQRGQWDAGALRSRLAALEGGRRDVVGSLASLRSELESVASEYSADCHAAEALVQKERAHTSTTARLQALLAESVLGEEHQLRELQARTEGSRQAGAQEHLLLEARVTQEDLELHAFRKRVLARRHEETCWWPARSPDRF